MENDGARDDGGALRRWTILAICSLSLFLVGLDTTIVNVALPAIGTGLKVGTRGLEWIVNAYTLALASLLISSGAVADRAGRRRIFRFGLAVFAVGSLACAVAPNVEVLVAMRVVQGIGGSMLGPVALAIVVNVITDPRERARAIGVWAAVFGISMAAGPLAGGVLVTALGWRSVFWINLPVVALALVLATIFVPESRAVQPRRLDGAGQLLLIIVICGSVSLLIEGPHAGWGAPGMIAGYVAVTAATAALGRVESRRAEPLVDPRLFRRPPFAAAVVGAVTVFVAVSATLLLTTLHLQQGRGLAPAAAGLVALPMAIAATVCAPLSGVLVGRSGPRLPLQLAGGFITAGGLWLARIDNHTDLRLVSAACLLIGAGFGFANAPITNTAVSGLPAARAGVAAGITSTARQVGSALGIAIAGSIITGVTPVRLAEASHPGWLLVAGCGLTLLAVALSARPAARRSSSRRGPSRPSRQPARTGPAESAPGPSATRPSSRSPAAASS